LLFETNGRPHLLPRKIRRILEQSRVRRKAIIFFNLRLQSLQH